MNRRPQSSPGTSRRPVAFAVVLAGTMAVATVINAVVPVLAPLIVRDLGIGRAGIGFVVTVVGGGGALMSLAAGSLVDRLGGRRMTLWILGIGMSALVVAATSRSLVGLLLAAALCSLGNGAANPATNTLIAGHLGSGRRGIITGVKQSGVYAGVLVSGAVLPPIATVFGWRSAVWVMALVPVALTILALRVLAPDERRSLHWRERPARFRVTRTVTWMTVYGTLMGIGAGAMLAFLPLYSQEGVGLSVRAAGLVAGTFGLLGMVARIAWAGASERLSGYARPLGVIALLSALAAVLVMAAEGGRPWLLWAGAVLAGSTVTAWNAVVQLAVVVHAADGETGRASGLVNLGFLGGLSAAPAAFGWAVDYTGSYTAGWAGVIIALLLAATTSLLWHRDEIRGHAAPRPDRRATPRQHEPGP